MDAKIKKDYKDSREKYEAASVARQAAVAVIRTEVAVKITALDNDILAAYEAHNVAKMAYAKEVKADEDLRALFGKENR